MERHPPLPSGLAGIASRQPLRFTIESRAPRLFTLRPPAKRPQLQTRMIENIRKYTGLMIVIFVILFISFFFLDTGSMRSAAGGGTVVKVDGRGFSEKEVRRVGSAGRDLTQGLMQMGELGLYQFLVGIPGEATNQSEAAEQFFVGRVLLRKAAEEFGIHPGPEEINSYIRTLRAFAGADGAFDESTYRTFIDKSLGRLGLTEADIRDLASDVLIFQKLKSLVGTGLSSDRDIVAKTLAMTNQQIDVNLAQISIDPFKSAIEPTDEEVKSYWETIQDAFTTAPRRKFTYFIATPTVIEDPKPEDAPETLAEAAASEEAKEAARLEREEERKKKEAEVAEMRRKEQIRTDSLVDDFMFDLDNQKGSGFEDLAAKNGWEVVTTGFFAQNEAPPALDVPLRASSAAGKVVDELFRIKVLKSDPSSRISAAIPIGENQWLVARQDEEEPSRVKTFEEAREEARAQFIAEKATEAMKTAADEAAAKIKEGLAAGKSFAEAAKEAGIEETHSVENVTTTFQTNPEKEPAGLFEAARYVEPGSLADNIVESDRVFILHVVQREVVREENVAARIDAEVNTTTSDTEMAAYMAWINARNEAAKVEYPGRR